MHTVHQALSPAGGSRKLASPREGTRPARFRIFAGPAPPSGILFHGLLGLLAGLTLSAASHSAPALSAEQQAWVARAKRFERHGWTYLHIEGGARERGFQHGWLLAKEIAQGVRKTRVSWEYESAMPWNWLVQRAAAMFVPHLDAENLAELDGIAAGACAAGTNLSRDEVITYNGIIELAEYWWPQELKTLKEGPVPAVRQSCSSFIATGSMTVDGNVVLGHNTMASYESASPNVIADIRPDRGHRILWQTVPGWIHSGMDFFVTDAGLVGSETTMGGFEGFDTNGVPEFARMRRATQDAGSLDEWCDLMRRGNNGGYANAWLLGDVHSREIARLELGLKQVGFEKKQDGFFLGSNVAEDPKILRFETSSNETDIRNSSVARRVRWKQLMARSQGKIDARLARQFEADHYDTFRHRVQPGGRSLCGHFELDPEPAGAWPGVPFGCSGTIDAKVVDAAMAKEMRFAARWGSACGRRFDARGFLAAHPQFEWMKEILDDRPRQPWTEFRAGE